jgi:hypothetical protein
MSGLGPAVPAQNRQRFEIETATLFSVSLPVSITPSLMLNGQFEVGS